jgi:hypothetical protein
MAISGLIRTYAQTTGSREDLEDIIAMISPTDTPLFTLLNRQEVFNTKHEWMEDALRSMTSTLGAAMGSNRTSVSMTVNTGHGAARFPVTTNYPILVRINEELMLGTARTTNVLTVTRDYNSLNATGAHASGATIEILYDNSIEGADAREAFAQTRTRPYNMLQIFDATVLVSGTQEKMIKAGIASTETDYQVERRLEELKVQVERALLSGTRVDGTATTFRSMGGLFHYISSNKTNRSSAAITAAMVEADARASFDAGGNPGLIICNSFQSEKITQLYTDRIRTEVEEILGGAVIQRIQLPVAGMGELAIIINRWVPQHEYYILDPTKVFIGVYRPFAMTELAKTGDSVKSQVLGEYTCVVKNEAAHARSYALATS